MPPTYERVINLLDYNPETVGLTWKIPVGRWGRIPSGTLAGGVCIGGRGGPRIKIWIDGKKYLAHRLIWLIQTGSWPDADIDHIDVNPLNNSWNNLRLANDVQNCANQKKPINNTSGIKGVSWHKRDKKWQANIMHNGKSYYLGRFSDIETAARAYSNASKSLNGEFSRAS